MQGAQPRRAFQTLDGLRGVGAFLVVMRHVPYFFGPISVPESFLAVDLFYLVSGFVVAHAYGRRLQAGGFFIDFMKTRIIRLYPLYAFGLALGVGAALVSILGDSTGWWTWGKLGEALATGALMIPLFPGLAANGSSLDGPTWTLLPELVANALYAAAVRFMNLWVLTAIILVSAAGVIFAELHYGTLDVGYGATELWVALARVGFSFFIGVMVYRLFGDRKIDSEWAAWACVAVLTVGLAFRPSEDMTPYYELGVVLIGFPALLIAASHFEPGRFSGRLFSVVGLISYGVYIVHQPMGNLARDALKPIMQIPTGWPSLAFGVAFLAAALGLSWWLDSHYDAPVRKRLRAWLLPAPPRPAPAPRPAAEGA
jgi:peptidoglycan/LPS O-acetylase OafA/YrhL